MKFDNKIRSLCCKVNSISDIISSIDYFKNTDDITQETKDGTYYQTVDLIGNGTSSYPEYPIGIYYIIDGDIRYDSQVRLLDSPTNLDTLGRGIYVISPNIGIHDITFSEPSDCNHPTTNRVNDNLYNLQQRYTDGAYGNSITIVIRVEEYINPYNYNIKFKQQFVDVYFESVNTVSVMRNGFLSQFSDKNYGCFRNIKSTSYAELNKDLKGTTNVTLNNNVANIEMDKAAAFQIPELTADTNINFVNLQENKQVKLYVKGNVALTFTADNSVPIITDNLSYDGNNWNIIVAECSKVNGSLQINLISLQ